MPTTETLPPIAPHAEDRYEGYVPPTRHVMPVDRLSYTHKFEIADQAAGGFFEAYVTAGLFADGKPSDYVRSLPRHKPVCELKPGRLGEVFLTGLGKEGSTTDGMVQWAVTNMSIALQFGAPMEMLCRKFAHMRFAPYGYVSGQSPDVPIPFANSIPAYVAEWLALRFGPPGLHDEVAAIRESIRP